MNYCGQEFSKSGQTSITLVSSTIDGKCALESRDQVLTSQVCTVTLQAFLMGYNLQRDITWILKIWDIILHNDISSISAHH